MWSRPRASLLGGAIFLILAACSPGSDDGLIIGQGSDRFPNRTATDWVTYADHVVVVTATDEKALEPTDEEVEAGEGYLPRVATLNVDDVIWTRQDADTAAPSGQFEYSAIGWEFHGEERTRLGVMDSPRIEVGHTYILVLTWEPAFDDGHDRTDAHWVSLGADSIIPYDDDVIGKGELEGTLRAGASPLDATDPNYSLEDQMAGRTAADLATALEAAPAGERLDN